DTIVRCNAEGERLVGVRHFLVQCRPRFADLIVPVDDLDELLERNRDEHAEDDDSDLARKLTPAVQRLRNMDVHDAPPGSAYEQSGGKTNCAVGAGKNRRT